LGTKKYLVRIGDLVNHEGVEYPRVKHLMRSVRELGVLFKPVIVDSKTKVVIDGHHRVAALKLLGAEYVPAIVVDYKIDIRRIDAFTHVLYGDRNLINRLVRSAINELECSGRYPLRVSLKSRCGEESVTVMSDLIHTITYINYVASEFGLKHLKVPPTRAPDRVRLLTESSGQAVLIIKPEVITHEVVINTLRKGARLPPRTTYHVTNLKNIIAPVRLKYLLKP